MGSPWNKKVGFETLTRYKVLIASLHNMSTSAKAYRAQLPAVVCRRSRGTACDI